MGGCTSKAKPLKGGSFRIWNRPREKTGKAAHSKNSGPDLNKLKYAQEESFTTKNEHCTIPCLAEAQNKEIKKDFSENDDNEIENEKSMENDAQALRGQLRRQSEKITQLENEIDHLQALHSQLKNEIDHLQALHSQLEKERDDLQTEKSRLKTKHSNLDQKNRELRKQFEEMAITNIVWEKKVERLNWNIFSYDTEIFNLQADLEKSKEEKENLQSDLNKHKLDKGELEATNKIQQKEIRDLREKVSKFKSHEKKLQADQRQEIEQLKVQRQSELKFERENRAAIEQKLKELQMVLEHSDDKLHKQKVKDVLRQLVQNQDSTTRHLNAVYKAVRHRHPHTFPSGPTVREISDTDN